MFLKTFPQLTGTVILEPVLELACTTSYRAHSCELPPRYSYTFYCCLLSCKDKFVAETNPEQHISKWAQDIKTAWVNTPQNQNLPKHCCYCFLLQYCNTAYTITLCLSCQKHFSGKLYWTHRRRSLVLLCFLGFSHNWIAQSDNINNTI